MHLLYCDETNLEERAGDFLLYGGLMVEAEQALELSKAIDRLRARHGVPRDYRLKFNPGPDGFSHEQFIALKREVMETAVRHGAKLMIYLVLHDLAHDPDLARRNGINTVCMHFQYALNREGSPGLVLIDRFNDAGNEIEAHLREKFSVGITGLPYSPEMRLTNIVGFHYSAIGQSHMPSVVDVVLGSLRFAINAHTRNQARFMATASELLALLSPIFWRNEEGAPVPELGLMFSPKIVRIRTYREKYQGLKDFLEANGISTVQEITDQRTY